MVVKKLTQSLVNKAEVCSTRYDIRDTEIKGLFLRIEPSGRKAFYINYRTPAPARRQRNIKISPAFVPLSKVRRAAKEFLARLYLTREDPVICRNEGLILSDLLKSYTPWVKKHRKSAESTLRMIRQFSDFLSLPVQLITNEQIELWRKSQEGKIKGATVNRRMAALQALLSWAVEQKIIPTLPFKVHKISQKDSRIVERFLSDEEKQRLFNAAENCSEKWIKTAIVVSLNTGIRKGTLLNLKWQNVDLKNAQLVLPAKIMKGNKDAKIPLNDQTLQALKDWRAKTKNKGYVFSKNGKKLYDTRRPFLKLLKEAQIENFTWHCLRHDFASQLVMKGVPLQVVQKLMCHSSIKMTERYAHLSDNVLQKAVELL